MRNTRFDVRREKPIVYISQSLRGQTAFNFGVTFSQMTHSMSFLYISKYGVASSNEQRTDTMTKLTLALHFLTRPFPAASRPISLTFYVR